eukprot:2257069-Prymnesium_polylepis.2
MAHNIRRLSHAAVKFWWHLLPGICPVHHTQEQPAVQEQADGGVAPCGGDRGAAAGWGYMAGRCRNR